MRLISVESLEELPPKGEVSCASEFGKLVMQTGRSSRVDVASKVHFEYFGSVSHLNLLAWQKCRGPFKVLKRGSRGIVGMSCELKGFRSKQVKMWASKSCGLLQARCTNKWNGSN